MGYHWTSYLYYSILLKPFHFFPTNYVYVRASLYFSNLPSRYYHSSSPPILLLFSFYKYPLYYSQISPQNLTHFLLPRYFTVLLQLMISLATQFFLSHSTSTSLYVQAEITKQKLKEKKRIDLNARYTHILSLIHHRHRKFRVPGDGSIDSTSTLHPINNITKCRHVSRSSPMLVQFASYLLFKNVIHFDSVIPVYIIHIHEERSFFNDRFFSTIDRCTASFDDETE